MSAWSAAGLAVLLAVVCFLAAALTTGNGNTFKERYLWALLGDLLNSAGSVFIVIAGIAVMIAVLK